LKARAGSEEVLLTFDAGLTFPVGVTCYR
jgi:hypothetical protein